MKILIILPRYNHGILTYDPNSTEPNRDYMMPVGLPMISACLKRAGYDVEVQNQNHTKGLIRDITRAKVTETHYDLVFTGGLSIYYPNFRDLIATIHEHSPKTKVVLGGGIISAQPEIMLEMTGADFGVIHEGEETCVELTNCLQKGGDLVTVRGIVWRNNGSIMVNPSRPPIADLDSLPYPDWDSFGMMGFLQHQRRTNPMWDFMVKPRSYSIIGARSCSHNCSFCYHTTGPKYRQRNIDNIIAEIRWAIPKYHINHILFLDELFAYDKPRVMEFCRKLKAVFDTVPWKMGLYANLRVDEMDDEMIEALKSVGVVAVGFGLESYDQQVLTSMRKHITPDQIENAITTIAEKGLVPMAAFIFGDPAETMASAERTLDFYTKRQDIIKGGISLWFIMPFPATGIYRHCLERGIIKDERQFIRDRETNPPDPLNPDLNMTGMPDEEFREMVDKILTADYITTKYAVLIAIAYSTILAECPACHKKQYFQNYDIHYGQMWLATVNCENESCRTRFRIVDWKYPYVRALVKVLGYGRMKWIKEMIA